MTGEFDFIRDRLAPLATSKNALGLADDIALIPDGKLITSMDMLVAGRHFRPHDPYDTVAQKLLGANVSDIVAKGARPVAYMLSCAWSSPIDADAQDLFVGGLKVAQDKWGLSLLGGDTVSTDGDAAFSVTIFGECLNEKPVLRSGARAGQSVWVSGTLGDAALGLQYPYIDQALDQVYLLPNPPIDAAQTIADCASASIDISDGLTADAQHIADQSGCRIVLNKTALPLSQSARMVLANAPEAWPLIWSGGDDYQTLLTADDAHADALLKAGFTKIGVVEEGGAEVTLKDRDVVIDTSQAGYRHF